MLSFHFNKNAELIITSTEPQLWTNAPTMGLRIPVIARMIARKFKPIEKVRLYFMVVIMRLDSAIRCGSSLISSLTSAMSAASTAISLPMPPIAIPTFAVFKAGASLMPSPIMQTAFFSFWYCLMMFLLFSGRQFAYTVSMPISDAIALAAFSLSPVRSMGVTPIFVSSLIMAALSLRRVSARAMYPMYRLLSAAAVSAMTTIHVAHLSAIPTIFALSASADCTRRIIRCMELSSPTFVAFISNVPN